MIRTWFAVGLCALVLAGCNKVSNETAAPPPADEAVVVTGSRMPAAGVASPSPMAPGRPETAPDRDRQWMAYSHSMTLMMDAATVAPHFTRARDACLQNTALNCILLSGAVSAGDENAQQPPSAQLVVSLPHDQVAAFQKVLLSPLAGQAQSDVTVRQQSTQADNLTQQVTDIDRRVGQMTTYRDRLSALAERPNLKAEDLIPLEEKISELQSELDQLASSKANIVERVKREQITVTFNANVSVTEAARPVSQAWDSSFEVLGNSASTVLLLLVALLPWLPVAALIWLVVWLVRRSTRRRREREAAAKAAVVASSAPAVPAA